MKFLTALILVFLLALSSYVSTSSPQNHEPCIGGVVNYASVIDIATSDTDECKETVVDSTGVGIDYFPSFQNSAFVFYPQRSARRIKKNPRLFSLKLAFLI
jgi:hypothetical protein